VVKFRSCATVLALTVFVAACDRGFILEGERFDLRAPFSETAGVVPENRALPVALPAATANADWTHRLGTQSSRALHPALGGSLQPLWSVPIGQGDTRRHRITAVPVAAGGVIYTLDSLAQVSAVNTSGAVVWTRDLTPAFTRNADSASGGGLAIADGKLFVTSAFGMVWALDLATGAEIWSRRFDAALTAPPTIAGARFILWARMAQAGRWMPPRAKPIGSCQARQAPLPWWGARPLPWPVIWCCSPHLRAS
jgi:outer membrane protein assembly factor BamB